MQVEHQGYTYKISIHALLAESDKDCKRKVIAAINISIHALLAESDERTTNHETFKRYFYPRSPCGERPQQTAPIIWVQGISIHALLAESDFAPTFAAATASRFLSTLSLRRATSSPQPQLPSCFGFLSTLSLRRATIRWSPASRTTSNFYPRSPCGERPSPQPQLPSCFGFLSTLSLRRATLNPIALQS